MKIGIDFGTSFSLAATEHMGNGTTLLPSGEYGIPSVFYYSKSEGILIGREAEDVGEAYAENMKREIKLELASNFRADGRDFTARDIVGHILRYVVDVGIDTAKTKLIGDGLDGVVISVPAAFTHNEKAFIKEAAEKAGLVVNDFIKEPVAAALAYFQTSLEDNTRILVYDLGGGTCDIAVVEARSCEDTKYEVLASDMKRIGGKNWDERIADYISNELGKNYGLNIKGNPQSVEKVRRAANKAKHSFSLKIGSKYRDRVRVPVEIEGSPYTVTLTRELFDEITLDLLNETIKMTQRILSRPECANVQKLICVGGSSNMPQVINGLKKAFPNMELKVFEPENAIALGAAMYAQMVDMSSNYKTILRDIASYSYGTDAYENYDRDPNRLIIFNLIKIGDGLPVTVKHTFSTVKDGQTGMRCDVYENVQPKYQCELSEVPSKPIMEVCLDLPHRPPKGTKVSMYLTLTTGGLLEVVADDDTGHKVSAQKQLNF